MFVVIFEVQPKPERWNEYLEIARLLRPEIERVEGFIDNERFKSQRTEGRVLSLSTWRDEKALIRWRTQATHHTRGQAPGRFEIFADYHLRVGEVTSDSAVPADAVAVGQRFDATEVGAATAIALTEVTLSAVAKGLESASSLEPLSPGVPGLVDSEWFESLTQAGKRVLLVSWADAAAASGYRPDSASGVRHRQVRVIRDYGMRDRREAPQYFPDVV